MSIRIEEVLTEAAEAYFQGLERDGYRPEGCSGAWAATSILAALKAARIAVVDIDEFKANRVILVKIPDPLEREDGDEFTDFPGAFPYTPVVFDRHPGEVQIRAGAWCDEPLSVEEARELAASILAAAEYADAAEVSQ